MNKNMTRGNMRNLQSNSKCCHIPVPERKLTWGAPSLHFANVQYIPKFSASDREMKIGTAGSKKYKALNWKQNGVLSPELSLLCPYRQCSTGCWDRAVVGISKSCACRGRNEKDLQRTYVFFSVSYFSLSYSILFRVNWCLDFSDGYFWGKNLLPPQLSGVCYKWIAQEIKIELPDNDTTVLLFFRMLQ